MIKLRRKEMLSEDHKKSQEKDKMKLEAELMKPKVMAEQHERLCKFIADDKLDYDSYDFRCERYGDFLAVFIKRGENKPRNAWYSGNKTVSAISLMNNKTVTLIEGRAPDTSAIARFLRSNDSAGKYIVSFEYFPEMPYRSMLKVDSTGQNQIYNTWGYDNFLGVTLEGCAAPSLDDSIRFEGSGVTLFIPFGKGKSVYDKILKAIKVGEK